jgi:hypothetical protein
MYSQRFFDHKERTGKPFGNLQDTREALQSSQQQQIKEN